MAQYNAAFAIGAAGPRVYVIRRNQADFRRPQVLNRALRWRRRLQASAPMAAMQEHPAGSDVARPRGTDAAVIEVRTQITRRSRRTGRPRRPYEQPPVDAAYQMGISRRLWKNRDDHGDRVSAAVARHDQRHRRVRRRGGSGYLISPSINDATDRQSCQGEGEVFRPCAVTAAPVYPIGFLVRSARPPRSSGSRQGSRRHCTDKVPAPRNARSCRQADRVVGPPGIDAWLTRSCSSASVPPHTRLRRRFRCADLRGKYDVIICVGARIHAGGGGVGWRP